MYFKEIIYIGLLLCFVQVFVSEVRQNNYSSKDFLNHILLFVILVWLFYGE